MAEKLAPRTALSRGVFYFTAVAFVFFAGYFAWNASTTELLSSQSIVDLTAAFEEVGTPSGAVLVGDVKSSAKMSSQAVYADFRMDATSDQVVSLYEATMSSLGWRPVEVKDATRQNKLARFCRGDLNATVETIEQQGRTIRYYFGVTRHRGKSTATGC